MRVFALLPAAGASSRMGRPKLALPLGDRTVLERVIDTVRAASITEILVVLGPHLADLASSAENAGARTLVLDHQTPDMRATVERGLDWLDEHQRPLESDAFLLLPPDHPALDQEVIALLVQRAGQCAAKSIFVPTHYGKRGHPALIGWKHVAGMRALPKDHGLNLYLRAHAGDTEEMPTNSADVLCDLDTPEDYERLLGRMARSPHLT